ncbi:MAG: S1 RNA-binding domain-containing protein [Anaerolineales bacterium]|jgi:ribosomal protein S1
METALVEKVMETPALHEKDQGENDEGTNNSKDEKDPKQDPRWYERLVEDYDYERPKRGQILKGEVLRIEEDSILMDVGQKRDAVVTGRGISDLDDEYIEDLSVGDVVPVFVTRSPVGDEDLVVSISRGIEYKNWEQAEALLNDKEMVELEVVGSNRGGLLVKFENLIGFVPNSHIPAIGRGLNRQKMTDIKQEMIGSNLAVKPIEVDSRKRRLVFSARAALDEKRKKRLQELEVGDVIESQIVNVVDFGVFVDLNGVDGLVHKSELDWERINNPRKEFEIGENIKVKVLDIDVSRERVSLSRKALLSNPWEELEEKYEPGDLVKGKVVSVLDFGAFVELPEGVQGLIHASEIGYSAMGSPENTVRPGEIVLVRIISIDAERERISLSMRRVPIDEQITWMIDTDEESDASDEAEISEEKQDETAELKDQDTQPESEIKEPVSNIEDEIDSMDNSVESLEESDEISIPEDEVRESKIDSATENENTDEDVPSESEEEVLDDISKDDELSE